MSGLEASRTGHTGSVRQFVCAVVLVGALAVPTLAPGGATGAPTLRLLDRSPLVVRGTGFERHEAVRVVYRAQSTITRRVVANGWGRFTVTFPVAVQPCVTYLLYAKGVVGSRAFLKLPPTMCPQPPAEP